VVEWLRDKRQDVGARVQSAAKTNVRKWQKVGTFGHTVGSVCEVCNTGWMHELEELAKPILSPLILPKQQKAVWLSADEQVVLASWLWKIAILHEDVTPHKYFNEGERHVLRSGDAPPLENVLMWISTYVGPLIANVKGGPASFSTPDGRTMDGLLCRSVFSRLKYSACAAWLVLGCALKRNSIWRTPRS
jgi:hypothetical protein